MTDPKTALTKYLQVPLTAQEKADKHEALVRTLNDLERIEAHFAGLKEQHKANVKAREATIKELSHDLGAGYVMRPIAVEQTVDFSRNLVVMKRVDTGAVVEERPLNGTD